MKRAICVPSSPFLNSGLPAPGDEGYALLLLLLAVTVLLISLTAALPSLYQQAQREREKQAIFRGEQYARAIYEFHRTVGRFPVSVKELLDTNGVRYLRKPFPDPLSPNGRWRFIHASATGILLDSEDQPILPATQSTTQQSSGFSFNPPGETQQQQKKAPVSDCQASTNPIEGQQAQTGTLLGAFIAGVAPCNTQPSIVVWNQQRQYDHWEFLGTDYTPYALPKSQPTGSSSPFGNSPSSPGQPSGPNQPSASPFNPGSPATGGGTP